MQSSGSTATLGHVGVTKQLTDDEKQWRERVGTRLRERREALRYSMDELANAIADERVYKQLIYRLENGKKSAHKLSTKQLQLLAQGLEWDLQTLADALEITIPKHLVNASVTNYETSLLASGYAMVRELVLPHNRWMQTNLPLHLLPDDAHAEDVFFLYAQNGLLVSAQLVDHVRVGMRIVFTKKAAQPKQTVLVHDDERDVYALVNYDPTTTRIGVLSLDGSGAATLHNPNVVGVMSAYSLETSSLGE